MRVAYANARYKPDVHDGANAHVRQFVANATALGHEVWMWPGKAHPAAKSLDGRLLPRMLQLRSMDVIYVRVEHLLPNACTWTRGKGRAMIGSPRHVWEFNTVIEFGEYKNCSPEEIRRTIEAFRYYGKNCDLAVCVSSHLADYARNTLGIANAVTIPNGSDPDLYRPDAEPVRRVRKGPDVFNVLWIGSAYTKWHNFELLGRAAQIIHDRGNPTNIMFHILGLGMDQMRDMPANVHYYGAEDYEKLPRWMSAMDVGLCLYKPGPADYSSPLKVYDYMSSGLTVVATEQPQTRDLFNELGQPDLLMKFDDPQGLADTLAKLSLDRERVRVQGERSRKLLIEKYTWRRTVEETFRQIEMLPPAGRGARAAV